MKAWVARQWGPPESLQLEELDESPPADGLLRIQIKASALNFFDALLVQGTYQVKPDFPFTPGAEVAGVVVAAPPDSGFNPGDRVAAGFPVNKLWMGGYAEKADTLPNAARHIPDSMGFEDAAAFFLVYQTSHFAIHRRANIQPGETLLVHGGAGGVGSAAIQLGKAAGATVIATAGSDEKVEICKQLGADHAINYKTQDFVDEVKRVTDQQGVDVIFDPIGGDVFDKSTKCIAFEGRLVVIGFTSGRIPEAKANHILVKNYAVVGLHWGAYTMRDPQLVLDTNEELFQLYHEGKIKPHISATYPLAQAVEALNAVASGKTTGKVLLIPDR